MTEPLYIQKLDMLPEDARGRVRRYIEEGFGASLSTFYRSILSNDLIEAWKGGDAEKRAALGAFVEYLTAYATEGCCGDPQKVSKRRGIAQKPAHIKDPSVTVAIMYNQFKTFAQTP